MNEISKIRIYFFVSGFIHLLPTISLGLSRFNPDLEPLVIQETKLIEGSLPNYSFIIAAINHILSLGFAGTFIFFSIALKNLIVTASVPILVILYIQIIWRIIDLLYYFYYSFKIVGIEDIAALDFRLIFTQIMFMVVHWFLAQDCRILSKKM